MNEHFVAIGAANSYPDIREDKNRMAEAVPSRSEGENQAEAPKTNGQLKEAEEKSRLKDQKEAPGKEEPQAGQAPEIAYSQAKIAVDITEAVGEAKEKKGQVRVSSDEMESLKRLIKSFGLACGINSKIIDELDQMPLEQVVLLAHKVLKNAKIIGAGKVDLARIAKIKEYSDEKLAEEKVRGVVTLVEDFGRVARPSGPGTTEAGEEEELVTEAARRDIREIIARMKDLVREGRNLATDPEWTELSGQLASEIEEFNRAISEKRFLPIYEFVEAIEDAVYTAEKFERQLDDGRAAIEALNTFLPEDQRLKFRGERDRIDRFFQEKYDSMDTKMRAIVLKDLELEVGTELQAILSGWHNIDEAKLAIFGGTSRRTGMVYPGAVARGRAREEGLDLGGLREWRATKELYGSEERVLTELITRAPARWEEVPEHLANIYRQIEGTEFSVEELQQTIGKIISQLESLPTDNPEARKLHKKIVKEIDAFRAFHTMRITMERNDMDPKTLVDVFKTYFDDETWVNFASRFSKDARGNEFVTDEGKHVNLFDVSFSFYSEQLRDERILMNMVEAMTMHSINNKFGGGALSEIKEYCDFEKLSVEWRGKFEDELEKLRQYFINRLEKHDINVSEWGKKKSKAMKDLIQHWHRTRTLHGAFEKVVDGDLPGLMEEFGITDEAEARAFLDKDFLDIRREQMVEKLAGELKKLGLKADFKYLKDSGFFESVDKNAYYLTWMFEWTNYDSIRIFNRESRSNLDDDFDDLVFHQSTHVFYGRHIDHIWEFYHDTNENRGRAKENDVNRIWKQHLPGKHHYLFPQNSVMVRWSENFMTQEQKDEVERRTFELMRENDFDNEKYHEEFYGWMRSVAVMDMIENGQFTFGQKVDGEKGENFRFSKVAGKLRKFEMIDVFIDRNKHLEYVGPQAFQAYLAKPSEGKFIDINDKEKVFYSTRAARQFPWMTLALRAHWEIANHHSMRLFDKPNLPSSSME